MTNSYDRLLRFSEIRKMIGLSRSTIWRLEKLGRFPKSRKISERATGWLLSEINEWLQSKTNDQQCGG